MAKKGGPTWNKGKPRTQAEKEAISRGQQERYRRERAKGYPDRKRCSKCKVVKDSPREFGWSKRKLKDGTYSYHPRSQCKECTKKRSAAYREKLRNQGLLHEKQKQWNANRKGNDYKSVDPKTEVSTEPIGKWLKERDELPDFPLTQIERRQIRRLWHQEYATTTVARVQWVLELYETPDAFWELYPEA